MLRRPPVLLLLAAVLALLAGCSTPSYQYRYVRGRTATLAGPYAVAPPAAPARVQAAIAAGNQIAGLPYSFGGGHGQGSCTGYDCSGAASHVLKAAGVLEGTTTSRGFRHYGSRGEGKWISVYARRGHVFLVVAGLRFDTGWTSGPEGPQWTTKSRPARGYVIRHPSGL